jgi:hypothetical protein
MFIAAAILIVGGLIGLLAVGLLHGTYLVGLGLAGVIVLGFVLFDVAAFRRRAQRRAAAARSDGASSDKDLPVDRAVQNTWGKVVGPLFFAFLGAVGLVLSLLHLAAPYYGIAAVGFGILLLFSIAWFAYFRLETRRDRLHELRRPRDPG